jgi:CheY-like chemotaxis protein
MKSGQLSLVLADDDRDDCLLFREALGKIEFSTSLTEFHYGDQLMQWLTAKTDDFPDALFLDLNMPRKNGFQCLWEIRQNERYKRLPVFIISTSYDKLIADLLYRHGANYFIQKPANFQKLTKLIYVSLSLVVKHDFIHRSNEDFVLTAT